MKNFVVRKLNWLEAVATDPDMRGAPLAVAVVLATRYLNNQSQMAWPGIKRLAADLGVHRRNVQRALDDLVAGGWLTRHRGGRVDGRNWANEYRIKGGVHATLSGAVHQPPPGRSMSLHGRAVTKTSPTFTPAIWVARARCHKRSVP